MQLALHCQCCGWCCRPRRPSSAATTSNATVVNCAVLGRYNSVMTTQHALGSRTAWAQRDLRSIGSSCSYITRLTTAKCIGLYQGVHGRSNVAQLHTSAGDGRPIWIRDTANFTVHCREQIRSCIYLQKHRLLLCCQQKSKRTPSSILCQLGSRRCIR